MAAAATILVVDDDYHITDLLENLLRSSGLQAHIANDGQQALDYLAANVPSLVVLDLMLPKKDGLVILESIRRDPRTKAIPVIVISAKDVVSDIDLAFAKGATEFLTKPLRNDRLLLKIKKHLAPAP